MFSTMDRARLMAMVETPVIFMVNSSGGRRRGARRARFV